jgi:hypothetical protein
VGRGKTVLKVVKKAVKKGGVTEQTSYYWKKKFSGPQTRRTGLIRPHSSWQGLYLPRQGIPALTLSIQALGASWGIGSDMQRHTKRCADPIADAPGLYAPSLYKSRGIGCTGIPPPHKPSA